MTKSIIYRASVALVLPLTLICAPAAAAISVALQTPEPTPPDGTSGNSAINELQAAKALSEAKTAASNAATAASNAKTAEINAKTAAETAKIGTIAGQTEIKGSIQSGSTPSKAEALLLVTKSTVDTGRLIANRLSAKFTDNAGRDILVLTDKSQLAVSDAVIFDLRYDQLMRAAEVNRARFGQCPVPVARGAIEARGIPFAAAIGTGMDLLSKFGSYFMTDYTYGEVTVDPSPEMLAAAVVQSFADWPTPPPFIIPSHSVASNSADLVELLAPLHAQYLEAVGNREIALKYADAHRESAGASAAACDAAAAAYQKSIGQYETLISGLVADGNGSEPLGVRVVRQKQIQKMLQNGPLILLLTGRQAAAYYTKKNLWTFLGGMPLYTMGGTSTTYTLFDPKTGHVLTAGAVAHHGGYRSVNQVERVINAANSAESHVGR